MTTLTVSAQPGPDTSLRPVPWRRMVWVTWRQHRLTLAGVVALLGAVAVYLLITGLRMHHAYAVVTACRPASSDICQQVVSKFKGTYTHDAVVTAGLLQTIPALIGAFTGAPVLAKEFETGTFRYAWTQGFGRTRWTIAKLTPIAVAVVGTAEAFSVLFSWYYQPIISAGTDSDANSLAPTIFDLRGVVLAAWTLAAFAIGALAGILIRRVLPAMFATLAVWAGLAFATGAYLRPHYEAPLVTSNPDIAGSALVISQWWTQGGRPVDLSTINQALQGDGVREVAPGLFEPNGMGGGSIDPVQYLVQHGYTQLTSYQPAGRFWPYQWIEGGWLLVLSLALVTTTVWLVRRRAA